MPAPHRMPSASSNISFKEKIEFFKLTVEDYLNIRQRIASLTNSIISELIFYYYYYLM